MFLNKQYRVCFFPLSAKYRSANAIYILIRHVCWWKGECPAVPLDPAMKPRMRAFSGLVTLLAVLNISWAAYIWSLWGAETWHRIFTRTIQNKINRFDNTAEDFCVRHLTTHAPSPPYRERQILFGLGLWGRRGWCGGRGLRGAGRLGGGLRLAGGRRCWGPIAGGGRDWRAGGRGGCWIRRVAGVVHGRPLFVLAW